MLEDDTKITECLFYLEKKVKKSRILYYPKDRVSKALLDLMGRKAFVPSDSKKLKKFCQLAGIPEIFHITYNPKEEQSPK